MILRAAKRSSVRPSELLGIECEWKAFAWDMLLEFVAGERNLISAKKSAKHAIGAIDVVRFGEI